MSQPTSPTSDRRRRSLTLLIQEPQFRIGDLIEYAWLRDLRGLYVVEQIIDICYHGTWHWSKDTVRTGFYDAEYVTVVQEGSTTTTGAPLRPGQVMSHGISDIDECAQLVQSYAGKLWEQDTEDNLAERQRTWQVWFEEHYVPPSRNHRAISLD